MEAQSEQMQASIETMFFSVRDLSIYGTGYRLLWWRHPPLTLLRRDSMIGMMWNHKLLLTSTTTTIETIETMRVARWLSGRA